MSIRARRGGHPAACRPLAPSIGMPRSFPKERFDEFQFEGSAEGRVGKLPADFKFVFDLLDETKILGSGAQTCFGA